jgi:C4-dicarboxylate transporter DctQ subunit
MPNWIDRLEKMDNALAKAERGAAIGLFILLIGLICASILARNILHLPAHGLMELAPTVVLWLALVGATLALKQQRHIKIELLMRFLPPPVRRLAGSLTSLFAIGLCGVLAYAGIIFVKNEIALFGTRGWSAGCFALFFGLAFFRFVLRLLYIWGKPEGQGP